MSKAISELRRHTEGSGSSREAQGNASSTSISLSIYVHPVMLASTNLRKVSICVNNLTRNDKF